MTYATSNPPALVSQGITGHQVWVYSSEDVHTDVDDSNYFSNGDDLGMEAGAVVFVVETDNSYAQTTHSVTEVSSDGATVSAAT